MIKEDPRRHRYLRTFPHRTGVCNFIFAHQFRAALIGLHVVDIVSIEGSFFHDISGSLGLEPYLDFSSKMREVLTAGRGCARANSREAAKREICGSRRCWTWESSPTRSASAPIRRPRDDRASRRERALLDRAVRSTAESVARKSPTADVRLAQWISAKCNGPCSPMTAANGPRARCARRQSSRRVIGVSLAVVTVARDPKLGERTLNEARR